MSFYERIKTLCQENGTTPTALCRLLNLSTAMPTQWKNGRMPGSDTLLLLANHFDVTTDYLLTGKEKAPSAEAEEADELNELLQELKTRPEMRMLFSLAKGATKEDVELAVAIIQRMRQSGDGE